MTLFNTAIKNMKGNFRNYLIYFVSILFSVVIYHTFVSLQYSAEIQDSIALSGSMKSMFQMASIVLVLFAAVFVWYSNTFFTRKRKKEVALYSLLGVRKREIGKMLFYENLVIGIIVLASGIFLGTLFSKMFAMILIKMLGSTVQISFSVSLAAILNTTLVFTVIMLIASIQNYRLIYRFKLIELFQADKAAETVPKASPVMAGLAVVLLAAGYWIVLQPFETSEDILRNYGGGLFCITLGTYMLFRSLTVFVLRLAQKNKARYYRGMNVIGTSQLLYRMKGNVRTLTIIALLSGVTLMATSVPFSQYYSNAEHARQASPFSYMHLSQGEGFDSQVEHIILEDKKHPFIARLDIQAIKTAGESTSYELLPKRYMEADEKPIRLLSASTYEAIAAQSGRDTTLNLAKNETAAILPMYTDRAFSEYAGETLTLQLPEGSRQLSFVRLLEDRALNWSFPDFVVVVNDTVFAELAKQITPIVYKAYQVKEAVTAKQTSDQLMKLGADEAGMSTYYDVYKKGLESSGMATFVATFLGLVFLAATGSVLYFKQLTEAHSDKGRYEILRKIGVTRKEIRSSIAKQSLFIFGLPLAVGIMHSVVVVHALSSLFSNLVNVDLTVPVLFSMILYIVIYLVYYALTVSSFNKIVNS